MNQDHASAPQAAETMLNTQATPARPIAYDQAIAFNICDRFETICLRSRLHKLHPRSLRRFTQALRA
jgi:hypothetical protein